MRLKSFALILILFVGTIILSACGDTEPQNRTTNMSQEDTVEMTIYAYDGKSESFFGLFNMGHSFLGFKNLGTEQIIVGEYVLAPLEEITISTWCIQDYFGVWYNIENNYIEYFNKYDGRYSVTTHINVDKLEKINSYIQDNNTWLPTKNCTNFSVGVWNIATTKLEQLRTHTIYTPTKLVKSIKSFTNAEYNKVPTVNENLGYFKNSQFKLFSMQEI